MYMNNELYYIQLTRKLWNSKTTFRINCIFKKFNDDETQQLCSVKRPISQNKWFYKCLVKHMLGNTIKYTQIFL